MTVLGVRALQLAIQTREPHVSCRRGSLPDKWLMVSMSDNAVNFMPRTASHSQTLFRRLLASVQHVMLD